MNFEEKTKWAVEVKNLSDSQKAVIFDLLCGKYIPRCDELGENFIFSVKQAVDMKDFKNV